MTRFLFAIVLTFAFTTSLLSQDKVQKGKPKKPLYVGAGAGMHISGSGYGQFYSLYASFSKGKHNVTIGPCLQKRSSLLRAGRITYSYILAAQDDDGTFVEGKEYKSSDIFQLGIYSYVQYADQLPLSYRLVKMEDQADTTAYDWNTAKMSTIEGGFGAELFIRFSRKLRWRSFFGVSAYSHTTYNPRMYQEQNGLLLMAGTSLNFTSFGKAK